MLIIGLLIGCKSDQELTATETDTPETVPDGTLIIETPEAVAWASEGPMTISGQAYNMDTLTLNEEPISISDDRFEETVTLARGLNHFTVSGVDVGGDILTDKATVLAGDFASPGDTMSEALSAHLGPDGLDAIGAYASTALDPSLLLDKEGSINPIYENYPIVGSWLAADLVGLAFSTAELEIVPTGGALELSIRLPDLDIDIDAYGEAAWIDYSLDVDMTADAAVITAEVMIEAVDGGLEVQMVDPEISLEGFAYDLSILPSFIEDYFFVETIQGTVEDLLVEQANEMVPAMIDEALAGLEFSYTLELLGSELTLAADFADVDITGDGVGLDMDVNVTVPGTGTLSYAGYLAAPTGTKPEHDLADPLSLVVSDDLLNRTLFEMWRGGATELTLSTEDGSLDPTTLEGLPLDTATISVSPQLPPVIVSGEHGLQLQAGAVEVVASTPGASFGEYMNLRLTAIADATIAIEDGLIQPQLGDIFIDIEVLESDWSLPDSSIAEIVNWALPQEDLIAMVSEMGIALPSLGGISVSNAEMRRDDDAFYSAVSVEFGLK